MSKRQETSQQRYDRSKDQNNWKQNPPKRGSNAKYSDAEGARKRARAAVGEGRVTRPISLDPFRFLAYVQEHQRKRKNDDEKHDDHRRRIADVIERERL